jgi:hypothetical protein
MLWNLSGSEQQESYFESDFEVFVYLLGPGPPGPIAHSDL